MDNPVFNLIMAQKRRARAVRLLWLVPVIAGVMLVIFSPWSNLDIAAIWPLGSVYFHVVCVVFLFHCAFAAATQRDPFAFSVKTGVADQFVLTGISPGRRQAGILAASAADVLHLTALYLPLLLVCRFLGGVSLAQIVAAVWLVWLLAADAFLLSLYVEQRRQTAIPILLFCLLVLILPSFALEPMNAEGLRALRPFHRASITYCAGAALPNPFMELVYSQNPEFVPSPSQALAVVGFCALLHPLLWLGLLVGILAGRNPLDGDPVDESRPSRWTLDGLRRRLQGPAQPALRTLPAATCRALFDENRVLPGGLAWDVGAGLVTTAAGAATAWMLTNLMAPPLTGLAVNPVPVSDVVADWAPLPLALILGLVWACGAGFCFSRRAIEADPTTARRLAPRLAIGVLRWALLVGGFAWLLTARLQLSGVGARMPILVVLLGTLVVASLAVSTSTGCHGFWAAVFSYYALALAWLGLVGVELWLVTPYDLLALGPTSGYLDAAAMDPTPESLRQVHLFFAGSVSVSLILLSHTAWQWRRWRRTCNAG